MQLQRRFLIRLLLGLPATVATAAFSPTSTARADPIHDAASAGDLAQVQKLLTVDPKQMERRDSKGCTPLFLAVWHNHLDVAAFLVGKGANVDARNGKGETALYIAAVYGSTEAVRLLLSQKANANLAQNQGKTPLLRALQRKHADLAPIFIAGGADIRAADQTGVSPLLFAIAFLAKSGNDDNPAVAAFFAALPPVSLHLANVPLREAYAQLFTQVGLKATVDDALSTPVSLVFAGPFDLAMRTLLRLTRSLMRQAPIIAVSAGTVHVGFSATPAVAVDDEIWPVFTSDTRFRFQKSITRPVLRNYLSRAVTHFGLLASSGEPATPYFEDDIRMLTEIGAKFIGRCAYVWDPADDDNAHFHMAAERAARVHRADPEIMLQAAIFEAVYRKLERVAIPSWAFEEFKLPPEERNFRYEAMLYDDGKFHDMWMPGGSVPDMSKPETKLWFYYRARRYIDAGCEALHFGQVELMNQADPDHRHWAEVLGRIRRYAAHNARRRMVLCDAHTHGIVLPGSRLLFDYHAYPLITEDIASQPKKIQLTAGYYNSIYGRSAGGVTPSGWSCVQAPYLVEIDNGGASAHPGTSVGFPWVWGMDSISWFAAQSDADRNGFLKYADRWLKDRKEDAHFQPPTRRVLAIGVNGTDMYQANRKSDACPTGFNQEDTIREIFAA